MIPGVISVKKQEETPKVKIAEVKYTPSLDTLEGIRKERDRLIDSTMWVKEKYDCQLREK